MHARWNRGPFIQVPHDGGEFFYPLAGQAAIEVVCKGEVAFGVRSGRIALLVRAAVRPGTAAAHHDHEHTPDKAACASHCRSSLFHERTLSKVAEVAR